VSWPRIAGVGEHDNRRARDFPAVGVEGDPRVVVAFQPGDFRIEAPGEPIASRRALRRAEGCRRDRAAMGKEPASAWHVRAREAGGPGLVDGDDVVVRVAKACDGLGQGDGVLGGVGDLEQALGAASEIVTRPFQRRPASQRMEKAGAREARGGAVVAPDDRVEYACRIAGGVVGHTAVALD
jgi:hypothetical protein